MIGAALSTLTLGAVAALSARTWRERAAGLCGLCVALVWAVHRLGPWVGVLMLLTLALAVTSVLTLALPLRPAAARWVGVAGLGVGLLLLGVAR